MEDATGLVSRLEALATRSITPVGSGSMVWRSWGQGPALVLLHGASGSWTHWIRNILPPPIRFDLAGFSFGAIMAGLVAARLGHRVSTLVLGAGHWVPYEAAHQINAAFFELLGG